MAPRADLGPLLVPGSEPLAATRASVQLSVPAASSHVRTARLVSVSAARRSGLTDLALDELRLAVGEACALVLAGTQDGDVLHLEIAGEGGSLTVSVFASPVQPGPDPATAAGIEDLSLAVLRELVPSLQVLPGRVDLTWPSARATSAAENV